MGGLRSFFKAIGSLWLAVVLLMLILIAMAAATAFESMHGTSQVQVAFYQARWFRMLLALLGVTLGALIPVVRISRMDAALAMRK